MMSRLGPLRSRGGYREVLKRVLTSVDFPSPDSPVTISEGQVEMTPRDTYQQP
jgi:hypothetical protein